MTSCGFSSPGASPLSTTERQRPSSVPAAGVDIGLRIGCAGGARRAHGGVEPALRPGGHAVEADKERRGRQRRHQRAPVGHFQRAGGEKEPDERRCGEREGQHREAGDGDGRAVELHDAAQARDQLEVGQVERVEVMSVL